MTKDYPWGKGTPKWTRDETLNDFDKEFVVPSGKLWVPKIIVGQLNTSADVANRVLMVQIKQAADAAAESSWLSIPTANIAASQIGLLVMTTGFPAASSTTLRKSLIDYAGSALNNETDQFMPEMLLPAGASIRVFCYTGGQAADDLLVILHYVEYDV